MLTPADMYSLPGALVEGESIARQVGRRGKTIDM